MSGLSTETLRKIYADGDAESEWFFDTWLAKHDAWTAEAERERIIKLLEAEPSEKWFFVGFRQHIIALIKGDDK